MKLGLVKGLALVLGGIVLGSVVSVSAQDATPAPTPRPPEARERSGYKAALRRALRSESVVRNPEGEGFITVLTDRGELTAIEGRTLRIREEDGHVANVTTSDETRFRRDGEQASISDLRVGDHVFAIRTRTDGALTTRSVRALSPERQAEMEERRAACERDPSQCRRGRSGRGTPGMFGRMGRPDRGAGAGMA